MPTVVILLSDKRSGSTMFQNELCKHPDIQTVKYSPHTYLETHHWLMGAVMLDMAPETFSGSKVYPGYGSKVGARTYMIDCIKSNVPGFEVPIDDRDLIFQGWEALCEQYGKPVFFEKSPQFLAQWASLSLFLEWIESTDYAVKVIGLTRNPLSVLYSARELFYTDPEMRQYGWLEIQRNLLAFQTLLPPDSFMHVKYEDIINNPVETFADICHFIEVPEHHEIGSKVHSSSVNKWESVPDFTVQLDETVKQIARHFGYSNSELNNPDKIESSVIQKQYRKIGCRLKLAKLHIRNRMIRPLWLWLRQR